MRWFKWQSTAVQTELWQCVCACVFMHVHADTLFHVLGSICLVTCFQNLYRASVAELSMLLHLMSADDRVNNFDMFSAVLEMHKAQTWVLPVLCHVLDVTTCFASAQYRSA